MKWIVNPETILDHVIAYTIWAGEVIQESVHTLKESSKYNITLVPFGPPFYTAILQAAGTLSINKNNKTAILFYQQEQESDAILVYNHSIWPILGKTFTFPSSLAKLPKTISAYTQFTTSTHFTNILENQIHFIRILSIVEELVIVGIGKNVSNEKIDLFHTHLLKKLPKTTTFFVWNLSQKKEFASCRKEDEKTISKIIARTYNDKISTNSIPQLFSETSKKLKKRPEIVAYTNSGDLWGNKEKTNGYSCLIA